MRIRIDFTNIEYQTTKTLAKAYDAPFNEDVSLTRGAPLQGGLMTALIDSQNRSINIEISEVIYVKVCLAYIANAKPFKSFINGIKDMIAASSDFLKDIKEIDDYARSLSNGEAN